MKMKKFWPLTFPVIALLLELLPNGVTMRFAAPPGEPPFLTHTSYFDLLPMGYANVTPMFTAVLTIVLLILMLLYSVKCSSKLLRIGKTISLIASVLSLGPLFFASYTVIGGLISISLFAEFLYLWKRKPTESES